MYGEVEQVSIIIIIVRNRDMWGGNSLFVAAVDTNSELVQVCMVDKHNLNSTVLCTKRSNRVCQVPTKTVCLLFTWCSAICMAILNLQRMCSIGLRYLLSYSIDCAEGLTNTSDANCVYLSRRRQDWLLTLWRQDKVHSLLVEQQIDQTINSSGGGSNRQLRGLNCARSAPRKFTN